MNTKENIIQTASDLFMKYGVRSITMDEIARELSISKKTIYQFFKDKDEIATIATQRHMELEKAEYSEIQKNALNAIMELALTNQCMRKHFREMNPSLLFDLKKFHKNAWNNWLEFKNDFIKNTIVANLTRGISEGYFREDIDPETLAIYRVEQVQLAFDNSIFPREKFDFRQVQIMMFDHFVHGILTDKGRKLYKQYSIENSKNPALN